MLVAVYGHIVQSAELILQFARNFCLPLVLGYFAGVLGEKIHRFNVPLLLVVLNAQSLQGFHHVILDQNFADGPL